MRANLNPYSALKRTILACMVLVPFIPFVVVLGIGTSYFRASIESSAIEGAFSKKEVRCHVFKITSSISTKGIDSQRNRQPFA
jgi:hypothetical protein